QVLRPGRDRSTAIFDGDDAEDTMHWVAEADEGVVGVVTVMRRPFPEEPGPALQLRGMAVHPSWQKKGVGRALLQALEADVRAPIWCNARATAIVFYERNGWRRTGTTFEIEGIGPHERMTRTSTGQH
ncbi:MAG: putative N-acetyltransferase YhbS, partial [Kiritimatiellia bacterium]